MPGVDGTPHAFNGMHHVVTVEGGGSGTATPTPDVTIDVDGDGWALPDLGDVGTGDVTFAIAAGDDAKGHSFEVSRVNDDALTEVLQAQKALNAWIKNGYEGDPPLTFVGGLISMIPGDTRLVTLRSPPAGTRSTTGRTPRRTRSSRSPERPAYASATRSRRSSLQ